MIIFLLNKLTYSLLQKKKRIVIFFLYISTTTQKYILNTIKITDGKRSPSIHSSIHSFIHSFIHLSFSLSLYPSLFKIHNLYHYNNFKYYNLAASVFLLQLSASGSKIKLLSFVKATSKKKPNTNMVVIDVY